MKKIYLILLVLGSIFISCNDNDDSYEPLQISPVNFDASLVPYQTLSEYNFFEGDIKNQTPVYGVIPYEPINSLFADYALKKRFVWMPDNVKATYISDVEPLDFPVGTILIKTFYYNNVLPNDETKIIETRLMIKQDSEWIFANYVWNDAQTEANLDNSGSTIQIEWVEGTTTKTSNYRIPSDAECLVCHKKANQPISIGLKPQNINRNYLYEEGEVNQLDKLLSFGYLDQTNLPSTSNIETVIDWKDNSHSLDLRARSYLDINCAHCHTDDAHCSYRPIRLSFDQTTNPVNYGECITPDENIESSQISIVYPGRHDRSMLYYRMNTINEAQQMPLIGTTLRHDEAMILIEEWINSLTSTCP